MTLAARQQAKREMLGKLRDAIKPEMSIKELTGTIIKFEDWCFNPAEDLKKALELYLREESE